MAETKKTPAKPKKAAAKKPAAAKAPETSTTEAPAESGAFVQSGMEPGLSPKEQRAKLNEQFAAADEKGQAAIIEETQAGLGVRGY